MRFIPEVGEESRQRKATLRMWTSWKAQREAVFSDVLYPDMTFAMASDTQKSVATSDAPCACLVSGCPVFSQRSENRKDKVTHMRSLPSPKPKWSWDVRVAGWC